MFYYNARYAFKLPNQVSGPVSGGVIAASALPAHTLLRRRFHTYPYLQHRLFDPQLYMAELSSARAAGTVAKLATYPWFGGATVPAYDSSIHGRQSDWAATHRDALLAGWPGAPPHGTAVYAAVRDCVQFQDELGTEAIILPSPLTRSANSTYAQEIDWVDAGVLACDELNIRKPLYATVALADVVLRGLRADANPLIHLITDQVTSRPIAGVYLVVEQGSEDGYCCGDPSTLESVLTIVDDCVRGANLRVIVNYASAFGAVAAAAGADIWSSGYYLSQRRLRLSDAEQEEGEIKFAFPRFYSLQLAGDLGIKNDLVRVRNAGMLSRVFTRTQASLPLRVALDAGHTPDDVPEWVYTQSNIQAASAHYVDAMAKWGAFLEACPPDARVHSVNQWLTNAARLADDLRGAGLAPSRATDLSHQQTWLDVFSDWRRRSGR